MRLCMCHVQFVQPLSSATFCRGQTEYVGHVQTSINFCDTPLLRYGALQLTAGAEALCQARWHTVGVVHV